MFELFYLPSSTFIVAVTIKNTSVNLKKMEKALNTNEKQRR